MFAIGDEVIDHEAAIDNLGIEPIAIQISEPQLRGGRSRLCARGVVPLEPIFLHHINMRKHALLIFGKSWPYPIPHALVLPLHEPVAAIVQLFHTRDDELPLGWSL
jgi:hypothetical protein